VGTAAFGCPAKAKPSAPTTVRVATGASPVPPKQSEAELAQPPNPCHSHEARSAKEKSAVSPL